MKGFIHSLESFAAVDGPGIRFAVFFQGCPLRCAYCHNPDTWEMKNASLRLDTTEIIEKIKRNISFYRTGGITATGGEPLFQLDYLIQLFKESKEYNIHTCLDTSGIVFDPQNPELVKKFDELIKYTDLVMLDIKHMDEASHIKLTGMSNKNVLAFAKYLENNNIPLWVRHVLVPTVTTDEDSLVKLKEFTDSLSNLEKIEFLPYHTLGKEKYKKLCIDYKLKDIPDADENHVNFAKKIFNM